MLIKQESITAQKRDCHDIDVLPIVYSLKVNLLYLLYLTAVRCCVLLMISCLLKTFLGTQMSMFQVSFYLFSPLSLIYSISFSQVG